MSILQQSSRHRKKKNPRRSHSQLYDLPSSRISFRLSTLPPTLSPALNGTPCQRRSLHRTSWGSTSQRLNRFLETNPVFFIFFYPFFPCLLAPLPSLQVHQNVQLNEVCCLMKEKKNKQKENIPEFIHEV